MKTLVMCFALVVGAVLQSALPSPWWLGHAPFPVLLGLVLYYALFGSAGQAITCALIAGLVSDSLALVPLGYTAFLYLLVGLSVRGVRDILMARQWSTHALLGGLGHAAATLACYFLLLASDRPELSIRASVARVAGAVVTGALAAPLACALLVRLERLLGHPEAREAA